MPNSKCKTTEKLQFEINQLKSKISELENSELRSCVWLENSPVCAKILDLDFNLKYMSSSESENLKLIMTLSFMETKLLIPVIN